MTAVDLTVGATLANSGEITTDGRSGIGGTVSQYPVTGEVPALFNVVSTPGNPGFSCLTGYGGVVPDHSHVAGGTQASPTAPGSGTIIRDMAARCYWNGKFGGSSATLQFITTEAANATYSGCMASLQLTDNGGGARQATHLFYGNGDLITPVAGGRLIIGASSLSGASNHSGIIAPLTADAGNIIFAMGRATNQISVYYSAVSGLGFNYANSAMYMGKDAITGRSANYGGTANSNGADYAEYEEKAQGCGKIEKGDVVGFDADGKLTDRWRDAVSFGVKSTNPAFVGGDAWGSKSVKHSEASRPNFDRIAYCGKVPVNVWHCRPGDYIIPARGPRGSIIGKPVLWKLWRKPVGRVRRILEDGRAEISVM